MHKNKQKSVQKQKKEATQEFFNKSVTKDTYTFNKAPINKNDAKKELVEMSEKPKKRSAFLAKLYNNDDDVDDMKVLLGNEIDEDIEVGQSRFSEKPRDAKAASKSKGKVNELSKPSLISKIGRLNFTKGSVAMFAVMEVQHGQYAIVNHTRNMKGFISLKDQDFKLQVGQLLIASVSALGKTDGEKVSKKLQLSLDPEDIYRTMTVDKVTPGMLLQVIIQSKEEKGYILNLGFKDGSKGFLPFQTGKEYEKGELVYVNVKSATSKLVKCELSINSCVQNTETIVVNEHSLRPGYLVNAKVAKIYENGLQLSFLGGMTGSVFVDHTGRNAVTAFKVGEKVQARVCAQDIQGKTTTLSLLPHIVQFQKKNVSCEVGSVFTFVKVERVAFGSSFLVRLNDQLTGFLHKSHVPENEKQELSDGDGDEESKKKDKKKKKLLETQVLAAGSVVESLRVKEINYFDGEPLLTMKSEMLAAPALDYGSLEIGQFVNATIESVNDLRKTITLRLNDFVKGTLRIEHIADYPVKVLPPKLIQTGKQIKVRVFSIEERTLLFTKKDSLMKHDVPIFKSLKEVKSGEEIIGVVVAQNEHGFIIKSFGEVKGLLTFADVKVNHSKVQSELKPGSIVKAYVLFNKKGSGLALTLDKKLAHKETSQIVKKSFKDFLPSDEDIAQLKLSYGSLLKHSSEGCVGKVMKFKIAENRATYYVLKSVLEKKAKLGVLPKPLSNYFGISLPIDSPDFTFDGYVFDSISGVPVVSLNSTLDKNKELIPTKTEDLSNGTKLFLGLVDCVDEKLGVTLRFPSFTAQVAVKDLQHTTELNKHYPVGFPVFIGQNKSGRLSLKHVVLHKIMTPQQVHDSRMHMLEQFSQLHKTALQSFKLGQQVSATVQLVKDYGLILKVNDEFTGFIISEHLQKNQVYKEGQTIDCTLLDIDCDRKMLDLKQRLPAQDVKIGKDKSAAVVELTKDSYMIVSLKHNRSKYGVLLLQESPNKHFMQEQYEKYNVGDDIEIRVMKQDSDLTLCLLKAEPESFKQTQCVLKEGLSVNGTVKSIKGHCLYVQIGVSERIPQIGRLHRVECAEEFEKVKVGDRLNAKILRMMKGKGRPVLTSLDQGKTWIELTKRAEHMKSSELDERMLAFLSLETIKDGQQVNAIITDVNVDSSSLVQIQVSPFVHGCLLFSDLIQAEDLKTKPVHKLISQFKIGAQISVYYKNGSFTTKLDHKECKKGDLVPVRFVKSNAAYGITVQISEKNFGNIEMCELSDEITSNLFGQFKEKGIFLARVIDTDKKGRLMLSSRESVVNNWDTIYSGPTAAFQTFNKKFESQGNLKNKILKFGSKLAVNQGDLFVGYVSNISKAGCFVNIGHNTTVRIGLNEVDDSETYDFYTQLLIGRQVVGRITKVFDLGDGMRFNASLRRSLCVYGVHQVNKNSLKAGELVTAFVLATAKDNLFAQIKGSYLKLNVKGAPQSAQVGSLIEVRLNKISAESIKADYVSLSTKKLDPNEDTAKHVYDSVLSESAQDLVHLAKQSQEAEIDIEAAVEKRKSMSTTEVQIRDLQTLAELEEEIDEDDEEQAEEEDSDDEDMKRIISKHHKDSDAEMDESDLNPDEESNEDEDMENDDEENGESDQDMADTSDEEVKTQKLTGKKALRAQITQEKEIRAKESKMRSATGAEPKTVNDFERLLVSDQDQSFLWIKYMAFMLDKLDIEAARRVAERAVKSVGISAESDKLNLWIAYMNLENQFGTQKTLQEVTNRALEINDRQKVYLQLINIYRQSNKLEFVEDLYKKLCKKYHESLEIWSQYIEFLFEAPEGYTAPKIILQRSLQALPKSLHINIISKFGMLDYKSGNIESGRTMFEGIITNYPKRMDIWSIYMDMEVKYGNQKEADNTVQARHLFERCLSLAEIQKKPKKMKLVFRKYMEFESTKGNKPKVDALRQRVEEYLKKLFKDDEGSSSESEE